MKRLETVLSLINRVNVFADIGCDHGKLSRQVLVNGLATKVYATDISLPSLNKAKKLLEDFDNAQFFHTDGLNGLPSDIDLICICGMGAHTALDIIKNYEGEAEFIIQPQNHPEIIRDGLCSSGYMITADKVAWESNKFYPVIKFKRGKMTLNKSQIYYGAFISAPDGDTIKMCEAIYKKLKNYPHTKENDEKIKLLTEVL